MANYDVIIVGAGPAGLFAAHELASKSKLKIAIIEKGKRVEKRTKKDLMSGIGGSGLFSDGKLGFTPIASLETLYEFLNKAEVQLLINQVEKTFEEFGMDAPSYPKNMEEVKNIMAEAKEKGIELRVKRVRHIGSDKLPAIIEKFEKFLLDKNVDIIEQTWVEDLLIKNGKIIGVKTKKQEYKAKYVIAAPGRVGTQWMNEQIEKHGIKKVNQPILVGVRVEFPASILEKIANILWEPFLYVRTSTFDDIVRTYCTCPHGYVTREDYGEFVGVNGHSTSKPSSGNSNFALLCKVALTEPVEDTTKYGESIAFLTTTIGGGKPIIQRYTDLKRGHRSTRERIKKSYVVPSLKDVTPGDISMALPHRVVTNIMEALDKLDQLIPGLASGSTLLYAPEIKFTCARIETNKNLETKIKNLYLAGDGAGVSGNIVGAACTGILAACAVLKKK